MDKRPKKKNGQQVQQMITELEEVELEELYENDHVKDMIKKGKADG